MSIIHYPRAAGDVYINVFSVDGFVQDGADVKVFVHGTTITVPKITAEEFQRDRIQAMKDFKVEAQESQRQFAQVVASEFDIKGHDE